MLAASWTTPIATTAPTPTRRGREAATTLRTDAAIETRRIVVTIGTEARTTGRRRRRTQAQVAAEMGISRARYAELERGLGAMAPLDTWVRVGLALDRSLAVALSREIEPALPADAGHVAPQEWTIGRALGHGRDPSFELPTPDAHRRLVERWGLCEARRRGVADPVGFFPGYRGPAETMSQLRDAGANAGNDPESTRD